MLIGTIIIQYIILIHGTISGTGRYDILILYPIICYLIYAYSGYNIVLPYLIVRRKNANDNLFGRYGVLV